MPKLAHNQEMKVDHIRKSRHTLGILTMDYSQYSIVGTFSASANYLSACLIGGKFTSSRKTLAAGIKVQSQSMNAHEPRCLCIGISSLLHCLVSGPLAHSISPASIKDANEALKM